MNNTSERNSRSKHRKILQAKLGRYFDWQAPVIESTVGPFDPSVFDSFDMKRRHLLTECGEKLKTYSDERIDVLLDEDLEDPSDVRRNWQYFRSKEIRQLKEQEPPWFAGGFGHPQYVADFENWCKMPRISIDEALSLTTGIEPGYFQIKSLEAMNKGSLHGLQGPTRYLMIRYEQLKRRFGANGFDSTLIPRDLLEWAEQVHFEMHPECKQYLQAYHGPVPRPASLGTQGNVTLKRPDKREIDNIAQLFTAMAIEHLGYRPKDASSPIPKEICDLASSMGISISAETVRKYLRLGARFISEDWKPE